MTKKKAAKQGSVAWRIQKYWFSLDADPSVCSNGEIDWAQQAFQEIPGSLPEDEDDAQALLDFLVHDGGASDILGDSDYPRGEAEEYLHPRLREAGAEVIHWAINALRDYITSTSLRRAA